MIVSSLRWSRIPHVTVRGSGCVDSGNENANQRSERNLWIHPRGLSVVIPGLISQFGKVFRFGRTMALNFGTLGLRKWWPFSFFEWLWICFFLFFCCLNVSTGEFDLRPLWRLAPEHVWEEMLKNKTLFLQIHLISVHNQLNVYVIKEE